MRCFVVLAVLIGLAFALVGHARAQDCLASDTGKIARAIGDLSAHYNDVPSCLACSTQKKPIEKIICRDHQLKMMEVLDTKAAVYALENATKTQTDHARPDCSFVSQQLARCTDAQCACRLLKQNTSDSLGGTSPYHGETR